MSNQNKLCQKFIEEVTGYLEAEDFSAAIEAFNNEKHAEYLRNNCWDLLPVFCKHITKEAKSINNELACCCEELLHKLVKEANPEEAVLEFLDQMDGADTCKFEIVLKMLKTLFSREMTNRTKSLEWTLNSIRSYVEDMSFAQNFEELETFEDEKNFFSDDKIIDIESIFNSIIYFYEDFVQEAKENFQVEDFKNLIASRLLQLFDIVFPHVQMNLFPQLKNLLNKLLILELQLISNPMKLLDYVFYRAMNINKQKKDTNLSRKFGSNISLTEEQFSAMNSTENLSPFEDITITSNLAYGMFFYSVLSANENEQFKVPLVYNPKYVMLSLIYVTVSFFEKKNSTAVKNGLDFLNLLLDRLNEPLNKSDLYFSSHKSILLNLNRIMVYSQVEENRKLALICFKKYVKCFNWEGRYMLLLKFRSNVNHPGTLGFLIDILKELISTFLNLPRNSQEFCVYLKYHKGKLLYDILKMYCFIKFGGNTDLVENADHIISSLNILRFLVVRDKANVTDIRRFIKKINVDYLVPLKEEIIKSREYYSFKLKEVNSNSSATNCNDSVADVEVQFSVKSLTLPKLTKDQQKAAYHSCLNAVDLVDLLHNRLLECLHEAYPRIF